MRKQKFLSRILSVLLACMLLFTGCQSGSDVKNTAADTTAAQESGAADTTAGVSEQETGVTETAAGVQSTDAAQTESQETEAETEAAADRYEQIVDLAGTEGKLAIFFIDLDEVDSNGEHSGDSTLLISPDGKVMLIDAGNTPCGDEITAFLKELGITKIDYLVVSHAHIDHIGGIPEIVANFEIGVHYRTPVEYTTQTYANYVSAIEKAGIPVEYVHAGDSFMFGEYITVDIYNPEEEIEYPAENVENWNQFMNDHSMLMKMTYGESTFLFGGDLYVAAEQKLVQAYGDLLKVDVAKVNHHGYSTSSCRKWVKTTLPQIAVAMGDVIGSVEACELYEKQGAVYYHTSLDGCVRVVADDARNYEVISRYDSWIRDN